MKKLKVVETFSGIGSQAKALSRLKEKGILDYTIVNTKLESLRNRSIDFLFKALS